MALSQGMLQLGETWGFSGGSVSEESTCSAEGGGSGPGFRRSPGERNGNPLQHSWENPVGGGDWRAAVHGVARVGLDLMTNPPPEETLTIISSFCGLAGRESQVWKT